MKHYVTPNCLKRIENVKGQIVKCYGDLVMVKTLDIYTVWNPNDGFIFCHTFCENEAVETFNKFAFN
jgi:hypothetical protein